ncbi:hypothetical protein DVH24_001070 [Malus domestica]|uniref:Uncharacterized protein n=1 Tax=Malus domestica TaxID=3750 RepID=A0A498K070_MALDO|nr:hypothetical protein DVH24_001070 [Malus domestica]
MIRIDVNLSFDVSGEKFKENELPEDLACELPTKYMAIPAAGKSIAMKRYDQNRHSIWIMREYGVVDHGQRNSPLIQMSSRISELYRLLGAGLYDHGGKTAELVSHDPKNRNEFLGIHTDPGYSCIEYYTESLGLLDREG